MGVIAVERGIERESTVILDTALSLSKGG